MVETPVGQLMNIVVDCPDADISARFWAAVLGWERVQETAGSRRATWTPRFARSQTIR